MLANMPTIATVIISSINVNPLGFRASPAACGVVRHFMMCILQQRTAIKIFVICRLSADARRLSSVQQALYPVTLPSGEQVLVRPKMLTTCRRVLPLLATKLIEPAGVVVPRIGSKSIDETLACRRTP